MIVFDASTLVSATFRRDAVPARAVRHALRSDRLAVSEATMGELLDVLARPRLARFLDLELRDELLGQLDALAAFFSPTEAVTDCRDAKDDKYLGLALAAGAEVIVSGDDDLLVLHPGVGCGFCGQRITSPTQRGNVHDCRHRLSSDVRRISEVKSADATKVVINWPLLASHVRIRNAQLEAPLFLTAIKTLSVYQKGNRKWPIEMLLGCR